MDSPESIVLRNQNSKEGAIMTSVNTVRAPSLSDTVERASRAETVFCKDLAIDSLLRVITKNSTYLIVMVDPTNDLILIEGGVVLRGTQTAIVNGSTNAGSAIHWKHISEGLCLEIEMVSGECLRTTRIRSIEQLEDPQLVAEIKHRGVCTTASTVVH